MIAIFIFASVLLLTANARADTLIINITGIEKNKGKIYIGVFNKVEDFPEGKRFQQRVSESGNNRLKVTFNLQAGKYAVGIFQDRNNNEVIDKNFLGIPKEKYGFSGKKTFGKPSFFNAAIDVKQNKIITVNLH